MSIKTRSDGIYRSKLFLKFVNMWIFSLIKLRIERIIYYSCFYLKKFLSVIPVFYLIEALLKIRPLIGFRLYKSKKKRKKFVKISPYYLTFWTRWHKALFWLCRSISIRNEKAFLVRISAELYCIHCSNTSNAIKQKNKYYKLILLQKTSKHYKW